MYTESVNLLILYTMAKSGKSSGKKLTKAEREKLKKEEEARKAQEEEEARIQAEKEAAADEERLKAESEERKQQEREECKKRKVQLTELEEMWQGIQTDLMNAHAKRRSDTKWQRYMLCDGSPDPSIAGEINTYMNLWRDDRQSNNIQAVLKDSTLALRLIEELEFKLNDSAEEVLTPQEIQQYGETQLELQHLLQDKLDLAAHDQFLKATALCDPETGNLQTIVSNDVITLCTWGNLSKNTRVKSHEFPDLGFTFDVPRVLALADCGVCVLYTRFDHLSHLCKTYKPRIKTEKEAKPEAVEGEEDGEEKKAEGEEGEKPEGEEGGEAGGEEKDGEKKEEEEDLNRETTEDLMATLHQDENKPAEEEQENKEPEEEVVEDYEVESIAPLEFEDFDGDDEAVDLRAYTVLGGVFHFSLIHMPPQPKVAKGWSMTIVSDPPKNDPMEYLADAATPVLPPPPASSSKGEEDKEEEKTDKPADDKKASASPTGEETKKKDEKPLLAVVIRLPQDVYFCEEPQVVRWEEENKQWSLNGFSDSFYNEENHVLSFKTTHFSTLALIQDSHINMPFQSWELRPRALNSALLTIIAAIVEIEIEIKDGECCYVVPDDKIELAHLKDKWMPATELIQAFQRAGVNLFPAEDSHKYVSIQEKSLITENRLYEQMSMTASCMAYSWSKWNADIQSRDKIIIQAAEHLEDEPLLEEDWSLYMISKKRTTKLKMTEFDSPFSEEPAEGTEFNADFYHATLETVSDTAKERLKATSTQYIDTIHTLLRSTRVITYS